MRLELNAKTAIWQVAKKEWLLFFSSPTAYLFLATFSVINLFIFFWAEAFFARNIADVRPLFEWMPLLLIFLSATLSMRMWSEERRTGTLEYIFTQTASLWTFVLGKFLACLMLLGLALATTLPLPFSVAWMGDLDWGPVWAGYLAAFLLGGAYLSMGLFVSAKSDNQIVSLMVTVVLGLAFYGIGAGVFTDLFSIEVAEGLRALATGARFEDITRGVLDLSDLYYYLSLMAIFLALNTLVLEQSRWADGKVRPNHKGWYQLIGLLIANAVLANFVFSQLNWARIDMTRGNQYSISAATEQYLTRLQEPLVIRGYFSEKTHPLLAPLVPKMRDLLREYEVASQGRARLELIDPLKDPEAEQWANQKYGIEPVPFQVADRYQSAIVSSYFNVVVQYGDEFQTLGFRELIEVKGGNTGDLEVLLRNPEYDVTRAIKRVINDYQSAGNLFNTLASPVTLMAYVSADDKLPEALKTLKQEMQGVLANTQDESEGNFSVQWLQPEANGGRVARQIEADYGFAPMATSLLSTDTFYFYLLLQSDDQLVQLPLGDFSVAEFERNLNAGLKRFAAGFTKTVGWVAPESTPNGYGYGPSGPSFNSLQAYLGSELNVVPESLADGEVSGEVDALLVLAPEQLDDKALFALDQYLMKGGTLMVASSSFDANLMGNRLGVTANTSPVHDWLVHMGLQLEDQLVLDPQNTAFPVPVTRNIGGLQLQDVRMLDYPYFVDVRGDGLNDDHLMTSSLPRVAMSWASPIKVLSDRQAQVQTQVLLQSSDQAWLSDSTEVMPTLTSAGMTAFTPSGDQGAWPLATLSQGRFTSYFADKPSPLLNEEEGDQTQVSAVIRQSSPAAKIILFGSSSFLQDDVMRLVSSGQQAEYLSSLQLVRNGIDWALEDEGLLAIRARGHFNQTLVPMEQGEQKFWEYLNYGLALAMLLAIALIRRGLQSRKRARQLQYWQ